MAFTAFTSAEMDADSPWTETQTQLIRTNFDDHETRILAAFAFSQQSIIDDFLTVSIDPDVWDINGTTTPTILAEHRLRLQDTGGAGTYAVAAASVYKMRAVISEEYVAVLQWRAKETLTVAADYALGFQDAALATSATTIVTDVSDFAGIIQGSGTNWKARCANGGVATETADFGAPTAYEVIRLTLTCSATAGNRKLKIERGATEAALAEIAGSPITTNLPTISLRPVFGVGPTGAGTKDFVVDYVLAYTTGRPLAA